MNFGEMKAEVFRRLNESSSAPVFWTEADVEAALNEGLEEISDATEWYECYSIISLLSNQTYYDLRWVLSDTFLAPRRAFNLQTTRWLTPCDVRDLDFRAYVQWETHTGEPQSIFMRGLWWLGFWPKKDGDSGYVKFYFTAVPPRMVNATDTPAFPQEFHRSLVEYALYDLESQDAETQKALKHWAAYQDFEARFSKWMHQRMTLERVEGYVQDTP